MATTTTPTPMAAVKKPINSDDAMENDLVLERIFSFCDVDTLKDCRLVCRKWRDLSIKAWRREALLIFRYGYIELHEFLDLIRPVGEDDDSLQLRKYPFKCYSVDFNDYTRGDENEYLENKRVAEWISNSGANHVSMTWHYNYFDRLPELLSIMNSDSLQSLEEEWHTLSADIPQNIQPLHCSNLKRLRLYTLLIFDEHSWNRSLCNFLLRSCFKLEALSVEFNMDERDGDYVGNLGDRLGIAKLLKTMRQSGGESILPLKELKMIDFCSKEGRHSNPHETEIIDALAECKFPLEKLSIHVGLCYGEILILRLLKSCKDTLQYLKASIYFSGNSYSERLRNNDGPGRLKYNMKSPEEGENVRMEVLKEMHLVNGVQWAMLLLAHLELPQLKKLIVEYEKKRTHCNTSALILLSFPKGKVFEKLETYELRDNRKILGGKTIRKIAKIMPNLTYLKIPLDKASFPVICQHFKGLKTLHVLHGKGDYLEVDDEALTGMTKEELEAGWITARRPNITDLEHLSDLTISCKRMLRRGELKITEHAVMHGFLHLPKLYNLSVAIKDLSDEMNMKLRAHVKGNLELQKKLKPGQSSFAFEMVSEDESSSAEEEGEYDSSSSDSE